MKRIRKKFYTLRITNFSLFSISYLNVTKTQSRWTLNISKASSVTSCLKKILKFCKVRKTLACPSVFYISKKIVSCVVIYCYKQSNKQTKHIIEKKSLWKNIHVHERNVETGFEIKGVPGKHKTMLTYFNESVLLAPYSYSENEFENFLKSWHLILLFWYENLIMPILQSVPKKDWYKG